MRSMKCGKYWIETGTAGNDGRPSFPAVQERQNIMELNELQPGQLVAWLREARGGYGYVEPIPGTVVKVGEKRVQIEVHKKNGEALDQGEESGKAVK
jgi:hypothetical protein